MNRRKFLAKTLLGLSAMGISIESLALSEQRKIVPNGKTVLVIGAGMAGISAAYHLQQKGFEVKILEAQGRIGGRIRTNRTTGVVFDEGASWIHHPKGNPITPIAQKAGLTTYRTDDDNVQVFDKNGKPYATTLLNEYEEEYENIVQKVQKNGVANKSFATIFNELYPQKLNSELWKYFLSAYLEFDTGTSINRLSSLYFNDDSVFEGDDVIVTNGYDLLINYLAKNLTIELNTPVTGLNYEGEKVIVQTAQQEHTADFVVVAVPLAILKQQKIKFTPNLPTQQQKAIEKTQMGVVDKFLLVWDKPFWDTGLQYIGYTPTTKGMFNYFLNLRKFSPHNALVTFALGEYALEASQLDNASTQAQIMAHLQTIYGQTIPQAKHFLRTNWLKEPYIGGSYSVATNGTSSADFDTMAQNIAEKVFFAGEHTSKDYRGTVHGAYLSGLREAELIAEL